MNLQVEEVQKILDEKYPKLCIEARVDRSRPGDGVWIFISSGVSGCILDMGKIDGVVKTCLEDLKKLIERSLEGFENAQR